MPEDSSYIGVQLLNPTKALTIPFESFVNAKPSFENPNQIKVENGVKGTPASLNISPVLAS